MVTVFSILYPYCFVPLRLCAHDIVENYDGCVARMRRTAPALQPVCIRSAVFDGLPTHTSPCTHRLEPDVATSGLYGQ